MKSAVRTVLIACGIMSLVLTVIFCRRIVTGKYHIRLQQLNVKLL